MRLRSGGPLLAFGCALSLLAGGCGGGSETSAPAQPPEGQRAEDHVRTMLASGGTPDLAAEYQFFKTYYERYPGDPVGALGYSITSPAYAASVIAAKHGGSLPLRAVPGPRDAAQLLARGRPDGPVLSALAVGLRVPEASRQSLDATLAADLKSTLVPALRDAITALGPLTQTSGVIALFTDEGVDYAICSEEVLAYRGALRLALAGLTTALAYSWESGTFDWERTPAQLDGNADGVLTPAEYLPPAPYGTLTDRAGITEAWNALTGAVDDAAAAATGMVSDVDPRQLLARAGEGETVPWAKAAQGLTLVQAAMLASTPIPIPYWDPATQTQKQVLTAVNLKAFWNNPPSDVRALLPTLRYQEVSAGTFDLAVVSVPDKTLGGVLPGGAELPAEFWQSLFDAAHTAN